MQVCGLGFGGCGEGRCERENTLDIRPFHYLLEHLERKEVKHKKRTGEADGLKISMQNEPQHKMFL